MQTRLFTHPLVGGTAFAGFRPTNPFDSDVSAADTVAWLHALAQRYSHDPLVISAVQDTLQQAGADASDESQLRAVYYWIKTHVRFAEDEDILRSLGADRLDKELIITPDLLLKMPEPMGDCDDLTLLIISMVAALGMEYRMVTVAAESNEPWRLSHIYPIVFDRDRGCWFAMDAGVNGKWPGWEAKEIYRRLEW